MTDETLEKDESDEEIAQPQRALGGSNRRPARGRARRVLQLHLQLRLGNEHGQLRRENGKDPGDGELA